MAERTFDQRHQRMRELAVIFERRSAVANAEGIKRLGLSVTVDELDLITYALQNLREWECPVCLTVHQGDIYWLSPPHLDGLPTAEAAMTRFRNMQSSYRVTGECLRCGHGMNRNG